jgi:hypothetical protein
LGQALFPNLEDDHAVKRSVTEFITPPGHVRSGVRVVYVCIVIFIVDCGVFNLLFLFQKPARVRMSEDYLVVCVYWFTSEAQLLELIQSFCSACSVRFSNGAVIHWGSHRLRLRVFPILLAYRYAS